MPRTRPASLRTLSDESGSICHRRELVAGPHSSSALKAAEATPWTRLDRGQGADPDREGQGVGDASKASGCDLTRQQLARSSPPAFATTAPAFTCYPRRARRDRRRQTDCEQQL